MRAPPAPRVLNYDSPSYPSAEDTEIYSQSRTRYESTHSDTRRRDYQEEQHYQKRTSVHSWLGLRMSQKRDTQSDEYDKTYDEGDSASVFNRLQKDHPDYKPKICAVYNPEAKHNYNLIYRPAEAAEQSKFVKEIALVPLSRQSYHPTSGSLTA
ncbi:hypothetical protein HanIR_Chr16g0827491 [Helianthus annuus]|nr:hypothetical protein HanIR_Chr16g0827491 [Helianthus annuus]